MKQNIIDELEICIVSINAGSSLEDCLKRYPEHAEELSELLKTSKTLSALRADTIPAEAKDRSKRQVLSQGRVLLSQSEEYSHRSLRDKLAKNLWHVNQAILSIRPVLGRLVIAFGIAAIFLLLSGGLLITSAKSLPGDSLYPVKLAVEDLRFRLAPNVITRHEYESLYTKQRVEEVNSLLVMGRSHQVSFEGVVVSITDSGWNVVGIQVEVRPTTIIVGGIGGIKEIEPGMVIEVEGTTNPNGWVDADELHIREYQFIGSVDKIRASYWLISGIKVNIPPIVRIDRAIQMGDDVSVTVHSEDSGLYAISILRINHATATATQALSSMMTETVEDKDHSEDRMEYYAQGIVEEVKSHYWVINGEIYFVVSSTEFDGDISIGSEVRVEYSVENNGSFTAIKIEMNDRDEELEASEQETPHPTEFEDGEATSQVKETEGHEESGQTAEPSETPHPTETPEPDD